MSACLNQFERWRVLISYRWLIQQLCDDVSMTLSVTLGLSQRVKPQPAIALRVSRNVEEIIADVEGPGKILHWLKILGRHQSLYSCSNFQRTRKTHLAALWQLSKWCIKSRAGCWIARLGPLLKVSIAWEVSRKVLGKRVGGILTTLIVKQR